MRPITAAEAWEIYKNADCLYTNEEVEAALNDMAQRISAELTGTDPVLVCVLNGGVVPFGKILPELQFPLEVDYVHVTRYGEVLRGGELQWLAGPQCSPEGRTIVLVDDILDEGITLEGIIDYFKKAGARRVYSSVLVVKDRPRTSEISVDFTGLTVPNRYVFGYGMDYKGYLRNLPGIYAEGN